MRNVFHGLDVLLPINVNEGRGRGGGYRLNVCWKRRKKLSGVEWSDVCERPE